MPQLEIPPVFALSALSQPGIQPKLLTLVIVHQEGRVLLGEKKRGFGAGYFNGFGGKVEPGETILEAALRELKEEACISSVDIKQVGILTFIFDDNPQPWEVHVFRVGAFDGIPAETEEMRPQWFKQAEIPFDVMWADDVYWYPLFLSHSKFAGLFAFTNTTKLVWHDLRQLQDDESMIVLWQQVLVSASETVALENGDVAD